MEQVWYKAQLWVRFKDSTSYKKLREYECSDEPVDMAKTVYNLRQEALAGEEIIAHHIRLVPLSGLLG